MRVLLDEDVPAPLLELLRHLLRDHEVEHVYTLRWRGKRDVNVLKDGANRGFDAILTNDLNQFNDPDECKAIQRSGLHHIRYELRDGLDGLALASAAICAAIRPLVSELEQAPAQRVARIHAISPTKKRYDCDDPSTKAPSPYW